MKKLSVIMPVLNEAGTLAEILNRVWAVALPNDLKIELIIVDNGSTDGSLRIAERFRDSHPDCATGSVSVWKCPVPGKGSSVRLGFQHATGDIILIQDADLEYEVSDYGQLLEPILDGRAEFVLGSRHLSAGHWKIRKFERRPLRSTLLNLGGIFFHGLFNLTYGVQLTDPTTMYKVFRRDCIRNLTFRASRFDFDYELLGKLIRSGFVPLEVPVSYNSRDFAEGKKIRVLADPWTWLWAILRFRWARL